MKKQLVLPGAVALMFLSFAFPLLAQDAHAGHGSDSLDFTALWFNILELPFLILCIVYAFLTAKTLKGGVFGSGMNLMAWGFLVMAVGHMHMQIEHLFGLNIFAALLGDSLGKIVWVVALIVTWGLSGFGFYRLYKASKSI